MNNKTEEILEKTDLKTLWSDTLFELLNDALENSWSNNALRHILNELKNKGHNNKKVIERMKKTYGEEVSQKLYEKLEKRM
jgi:alpha-N-acetylglucosamine transferase